MGNFKSKNKKREKIIKKNLENTENEEQKYVYKILLIGDSSVGKYYLFKKITQGIYSDKTIATIGIDRKTVSYKVQIEEKGKQVEKNFDIQLWDTAGQERFRSISKGYYKDTQGILLMYDITNKETFDNLDIWLKNIKEITQENVESENIVYMIIGNNLDLAENGKRQISTSEAEQFCKENNLIWGGEISTKDNTRDELNEIFIMFIKEIYKKLEN